MEFIKVCVILAAMLMIGGFVLNLLFMLLFGVIGLFALAFEWFTNLFKKEND